MRTVWNGFFSYLGFPEALEDIHKVKFTMTLDFSKATFEGVTTDEESLGLFDSPITVSGLLTKISLVLLCIIRTTTISMKN